MGEENMSTFVDGVKFAQNCSVENRQQFDKRPVTAQTATNVSSVASFVIDPVADQAPVAEVATTSHHLAAGNWAQRAAKRGLDVLLAGLGLLILTPVLLLIALVIRLDSPGAAVYTQRRVGLRGQHFTMLKFRSMRKDADRVRAELLEQNEGAGPLFKLARDPRITRVGQWLRVTSMDELPQLVNVFLGQMSLVGPRPALPEEVASYDADAKGRLAVKPGLTGLWQVSGRSDLDWEQSLALDLHYVKRWSVIGDIVLLGRTVVAVATRRGAY